jgi:hypothetical protein
MLGRCTLPMNATGSQGQQFFGCGVVHYERRQDKILAGEEAADFCFTPASYGEDAKIGTSTVQPSSASISPCLTHGFFGL